jgi:hypothetical protein
MPSFHRDDADRASAKPASGNAKNPHLQAKTRCNPAAVYFHNAWRGGIAIDSPGWRWAIQNWAEAFFLWSFDGESS